MMEKRRGRTHTTTRKFGGKKYALRDEFDSTMDAKKLAEKLRGEGFFARVTTHRYSPPTGQEFNLWKVWMHKKRKCK